MKDIFHFKKFSLKQSSSLLKVGTDAVLLGAYIDCKDAKHILDIGTGTGIIALALAQKSEAIIHALDINSEACKLANENFQNSNWSNRLTIFCQAVQNFETDIKYDIIVSNPPYFSAGNASPNKGKAIAKHDNELKLSDLLLNIKRLLNKNGLTYLIFPALQHDSFIQECENAELFVSKKLFIIPKKGKQANRIIFELSHQFSICENSHLTIENDFRHDYSEEYKELTKDYYLKF